MTLEEQIREKDARIGAMEKALLLSENRFRSLIQAAGSVIMLISPKYEIQEFNLLAEIVFDAKRKDVIGKRLDVFLSDKGYEDFLNAITLVVRGAAFKNKEFPVAEPHGHDRMYFWNITRQTDRRIGKFKRTTGVIIIGQDITELTEYRNKLEMKVRARTEELHESLTRELNLKENLRESLDKEKELSELKSRFVAMVSHEFRTPLSAILSSTDILRRYGGKMEEEQRLQRLDKIQENVRLMTLLLEDVLTLGKFESNYYSVNPSLIDVKKFCENIIETVKRADEKKQTIEINGLDFAESRFCELDERHLRHILMNLLSNALNYSPPGSTVHFNVSFERDRIVFRVKDDGIGIPHKDLPHLFEPFHRADNVSNIKGTGLGLSIVKKSVEVQGGEILVQSQEGQGTEFIVILPLRLGVTPEAWVTIPDFMSVKPAPAVSPPAASPPVVSPPVVPAPAVPSTDAPDGG